MELKRLGKYEIVAKIGQGAMGQVHRAYDPILDRTVAIKTMAAGVDADDELRRRFHREAQSAARLNHPNIITIYDFGEEQGHMYIAMELLEGGDLKEAINRQRPMSLEAKLGLMDQICDGLAFAHARDVIHRDLKPANIHLQPNGQVTIVDFGLARAATAADLTGAGMMLGTPNYMAPEQVRGEKATIRSDVFALGVVFYELLAGRKPFDADSLAGVLFQVVQKDPEPLERVRPELAPIASVIQTALAKDPAKRFANAGEFREALRAARAPVQSDTWRTRPAVPFHRAGPSDDLGTAGTLVRALSSPGGASEPVPATQSFEATPVPATTRTPLPSPSPEPPTLAAAPAETVAAPAALPTLTVPSAAPTLEATARPEPATRQRPPRTRIEATRPPRLPAEPHPPREPRAPARTALPLVLAGGAGALAFIGLGVAFLVARGQATAPSPPSPTTAGPPSSTLTSTLPSIATPPVTIAATPAPPAAPTPAPHAGPGLAEAARGLRERDYRSALAAARSFLTREPPAEDADVARRIADEAQRALRAADDTAASFERAIAAGDPEKASQAFSRLVAQDPRRPGTSVLADRLHQALERRAKEATLRPAPAASPIPSTTLAAAVPPPPTAAPSTVPAATLPTPPAAAPVPAVQSEAAARQAIRGVLDEYRAAFERRDAQALRAVQPGVDYEAMRKTFASVTGYTVRVDVKEVTVKGNEGTASCVVTYLPQPKPAQKIPPQSTVFHLRRTGDVWTIERLERR